MSTTLRAERVRRDIEVLAQAGLDIATFVAESEESLRRAIPNCGSCVATLDPATSLLTGTYKFGDLAGRDEADHEWGIVEYSDPEPTSFTELHRLGVPAVGMRAAAGAGPVTSARIRDVMEPHFGYTDELRVVAGSGERLWGAFALFRSAEDQPFSSDEVAFVASLAETLGRGFRAGLLARVAGATPPEPEQGPAVLIVGADGRPSQMSVGAEARLAAITDNEHSAAPVGLVSSLVAGARRYAAGATEVLPRSRVRSRSGRWFVLHASPLAGRDGASGDVVVTIEEARPPEIVPLVVAAFELTPRERDVTQLVLQGVETKKIAATLHMSAYTVQDHLKSVFEKASVCSRRELIARVFFDQYVPRLGGEIAPSGWFAPR